MLAVICSVTCRSLLGGAELHEFAAGVDDRDVAGRQVERVAGLEDLVVVRGSDR